MGGWGTWTFGLSSVLSLSLPIAHYWDPDLKEELLICSQAVLKKRYRIIQVQHNPILIHFLHCLEENCCEFLISQLTAEMQSEMSTIFSCRKQPALKQAVWQSETLSVATLEKPDFSSLSKISVTEPRTEHSSEQQHLFSWLCLF